MVFFCCFINPSSELSVRWNVFFQNYQFVGTSLYRTLFLLKLSVFGTSSIKFFICWESQFVGTFWLELPDSWTSYLIWIQMLKMDTNVMNLIYVGFDCLSHLDTNVRDMKRVVRKVNLNHQLKLFLTSKFDIWLCLTLTWS